MGGFVNQLKLSRRCLALWREILERVPNAVLAVSPRSPEHREIYARLFSAVGIGHSRVCVVPQGRDDEENRARYNIVDFVLDPMPFGSAICSPGGMFLRITSLPATMPFTSIAFWK